MAKPVKHYGKWRIRWVDENGERQSEVYDSRTDAVLALQRHELTAKEVKLGVRLPTPPKKTVDQLCDHWLATRAPLKRSQKDDESIIRRHLRPWFGPLLVSEVSATHVNGFKVEKQETHDPKTLANVLTLFKSMLYEAQEAGWIVKVPKIKKPKSPRLDKNYRYLKTDDEVTRVLRAAKEEGDVPFAMYSTAIYGGPRAGELAAMRWKNVDFKQRLICIEGSFEGPTKSGEPRFVPILDALLPILKAWKLRCPGELLFPNENGGMFGPSGRIFQEVLHRVLDRAGFPQVKKKSGRVQWYVTFHGLRHTFASHWMMNGGDLFRLQKILGHQSIEMTQRYAHLAKDVFAGDYARLGPAPDLDKGVVLSLPSAEEARSEQSALQ